MTIFLPKTTPRADAGAIVRADLNKRSPTAATTFLPQALRYNKNESPYRGPPRPRASLLSEGGDGSTSSEAMAATRPTR